jgi:hypothetical protein
MFCFFCLQVTFQNAANCMRIYNVLMSCQPSVLVQHLNSHQIDCCISALNHAKQLRSMPQAQQSHIPPQFSLSSEPARTNNTLSGVRPMALIDQQAALAGQSELLAVGGDQRDQGTVVTCVGRSYTDQLHVLQNIVGAPSSEQHYPQPGAGHEILSADKVCDMLSYLQRRS